MRNCSEEALFAAVLYLIRARNIKHNRPNPSRLKKKKRLFSHYVLTELIFLLYRLGSRDSTWLARRPHSYLSGSVQFSSVQLISCVWLCYPMDCSTPGLPVHHQLPEFTQTHVRWVGDAIQPSHPPLSHSPPAFNLSQHQGLFKWVSSSH